MKLKEYIIEITTDADGDSTDTSESSIFGRLYAVDVVDGTLADNFDITLTYSSGHSAVSKTLLTLTNLSADATYYPREQVHDNAGAGVTYDGSNEIYEMPIVAGLVTATTGDGGATKSGAVVLYILE